MDHGRIGADANTTRLRSSGGRGGGWIVNRAPGGNPPETPGRLASSPQPVGRRGGKAFAAQEPGPRRGDEAARPTRSRSLRGLPGGDAGLRDGRDGRRSLEDRTQGRAQEGCKGSG